MDQSVMSKIIYDILCKYYQRLWGDDHCYYMSVVLAKRILKGDIKTRGDVMHFVWMQTSGGGVAELSSGHIQAALPAYVEDKESRTYA